MLIAILDILSFITVGILTIPAWLQFFFQALADLGNIGTPTG